MEEIIPGQERPAEPARLLPNVGPTVRLRDLEFIDLYISLHTDLPSYYQTPQQGSFQMVQKDVPPEYEADIKALRDEVERALQAGPEGGLSYDGMRLRASKITNTRGQAWCAMRRIDEKPPLLEKLGFMQQAIDAIRSIGTREGLVLVSGATGQGKTTTASAMLYDYLNRNGGVAFTIEDPVEYLMDGRHGKGGLCYQAEVHKEADWSELLKRSLRWHPRYIMVGEVRTPEAANQLLRAANSGHLVITTVHAGSIEEGLEGILHLAEQVIGSHAPILLASGLCATLHQQFAQNMPTMRMYIADPTTLGDPVRALIRDRKIGAMTSFVDQQMARRSQLYAAREMRLNEKSAEELQPAAKSA